MAQQTSVTLVDDIDGGKAAETVKFGLDGSNYEIDLNKRNAASLRRALSEFVDHGRRLRTERPVARRARSSNSATSGVDIKAVRTWAVQEGIEVSARGRVPRSVIERYQDAQRLPAQGAAG